MLSILLSIFSPIGRLLKAFWAWATANPMRLVIIALLALSAFLALSNASLRGDVRHVRKLLANEQVAHVQTKADYAKAQADAAALNRNQVARIENERREIANAKDTEIRGSIARAVADARRVWATRAAQGFASGSTTSQAATGPVDIDGAGGMSEFFTEDDVRICTINTMKAKGWQDFYREIGRAVTPATPSTPAT